MLTSDDEEYDLPPSEYDFQEAEEYLHQTRALGEVVHDILQKLFDRVLTTPGNKIKLSPDDIRNYATNAADLVEYDLLYEEIDAAKEIIEAYNDASSREHQADMRSTHQWQQAGV